MRNPYPSFNDLVRFRNQYIITRNLEHPTIVQPLTLERYHNGYALVMPDEGALSLLEYWQKSPGNITQLLSIALQLASALHYLGQNRIIHKDIKPSNILIHPENHKIQLIDFSISSLLPKEEQQLVNPNILEGTLAYISPEQTGRMNRGIDYRTDFYSLGVTLYELLTGILPFQSNDPVDLLHCHIAKAPLAPNELLDTQGNPYPEAISQIILKLMAKNAEERYQSALGLKHDLEQCWQQWQTTGKITPFELGERDICDRFLIPEKLYGREKEVQILLDAFERIAAGETEMMLVTGFSGIGKTAVVNEVHKPIVEKRGYFIKGKFDQFNRNIPFSAFVQAFRDLMGQLLSESDVQLQQWKSKILNVVGDNGQVIIEVIPELEGIVGKQPPVPELSGSAAQNRFNLLFSKFIQVFTTKNHPLVIFLDDLQWADSASLNLLKLLMEETETGYLLVLGAYRDNEVYPAHPLMLTLDEISKNEAIVNTITLDALSQSALNYLIADTLSCSLELALPLTELVYQKTKGNPFFATQFLKGLHEDRWISFNSELGYWQCDLVPVRQLALTEDVVEFMAGRLQKLSTATQEVLKLAACIGNQFDLATLAIVSEHSETETATALWKALQEGLVLPTNEVYKFYQSEENSEGLSNLKDGLPNYKFLHDRVQQAAYFLIPEGQKQTTHYHIGQLLLQQIPLEDREERIFELVSQLNYGTDLITDRKKREELALLNLIASRKARAATAYQAAQEYIKIGLSLLAENSWQSQYKISLDFHNLAAELASLCGDFAGMEQFIETVIDCANSLMEQATVYRIKIQAYVAQNKLIEAISIAQQFLQQMGVKFPESPTQEDTQNAIIEIEELIGDREIEDLIELPIMTECEQIVIVEIAVSIMPVTDIAAPLLFPLVVALSVKLCLQFGNTPDASFGYVCYGIVLSRLQEIEKGVKFGNLALQVVSKLEAKTFKAQVLFVVALYLLHRQSPIQKMLPLMQEAYATALEVGKLEFVGYTAQGFCLYSFLSGQILADLEPKVRAYCHSLVQFNQLTPANWCRIYWQSILNLLENPESPTILSGEAFQEQELIPSLKAANDLWALYFFCLHKLMLSYWFWEVESARNHALEGKKYLAATPGLASEPAFYFYDSLSLLATFSLSSQQTSELLQQVEQNQTQLQLKWANHAPMNHQHKVDLVEAEKCRILGQKLEAIELYDLAIAGAKENEYIQEEALANELAAKFYLDWGKNTIAEAYMQKAYYCYAHWGAKAKTDQLEAKYPQLLAPIIQKQKIEFNPLDTLESLTQTHTKTSSTEVSDTLDLASILQAAQTLSSTIELDQLLDSIVKIVLTNAGAQKAVLLIPQAEQWQLEAMAQLTEDGIVETSRRSQLLTAESSVPIRVIQYVKNTREPVLIDECTTQISGIIEGYLLTYQPQSVLCVPLLNQGQLVAIVYLEHATTKRVFTPDRLTIIQFLCAQAAVSLQNAQLYEQAQKALRALQQV